MDQRRFDELLLDWHLDKLDDAQRQEVEQALQKDPALRLRSDQLRSALRPLDHWTLPGTPSNLAERVMEHVDRNAHDARVASAATSGRGSFRFTPMRDVLAVAACLALLVSVMMPGLSGMRKESQSAMCKANLHGIFGALSAYQDAFDGALPYAATQSGAAWLPARDGDVGYQSNSRHVFLLLKTGMGLSPRDFICPGEKNAEAMRYTDLRKQDDFAYARNISYDSLNLSGGVLAGGNTLAYLGDHNPLFVAGRFDASINADETNSSNHGGEGQNILILDGATVYMKTPFYEWRGRRDNIWLTGDIRRYTGREVRQQPDDSFLSPGIPRGEVLANARP